MLVERIGSWGEPKGAHMPYEREGEGLDRHYTPYSARMSPETTHKLMGFYMEVLILGAILQYMVSASLCCFL